MKPTDVVYCAVTNSVLFAIDALFDAAGKAYRPELAPEGAGPGVFDLDDLAEGGIGEAVVEPGGEVATADEDLAEADELAAGDDDVIAADEDLDDLVAGGVGERRHRGRRGR